MPRERMCFVYVFIFISCTVTAGQRTDGLTGWAVVCSFTFSY